MCLIGENLWESSWIACVFSEVVFTVLKEGQVHILPAEGLWVEYIFKGEWASTEDILDADEWV